MHNLSVQTGRAPATYVAPARVVPHPATATVRAAQSRDLAAILALVNAYAADGLMLPRTEAQVAGMIDHYVVAVDRSNTVLACAALDEYSPSLAEVSSVAVSCNALGRGLGSAVVMGVERLAELRGVTELFAMSLTDDFFRSLGYAQTSVSRYPEKLARYSKLRDNGHEIVPRRCWKKAL